MAESQQTSMLKTQERMRRMMIAQQIAIQRFVSLSFVQLKLFIVNQ